jgi:hypothetical protein
VRRRERAGERSFPLDDDDARGTRVLRGRFDGPTQLFLGLIRAYTLPRFVVSVY